MFIKPFKIKSNNQLKGTERKKLCEEILLAFPSLTEPDIQNLLKKKDVISVMKVVTHGGQVGRIYCSGKTPLFIQFDIPIPRFYPTIFTLWHFPDLLPSYTMHSAIIQNLANGADLMLPGVILDGPPSLHSYGRLSKGAIVSINTKDNKAPVAVGLTALSSEDMYMSGGYGKCVEIIQVLGDTVCQLDVNTKRPQIEYPVKDFCEEKCNLNENVTDEENQSEIQESVNEVTKNVERLGVNSQDNDDETEAIQQEIPEEAIIELNPIEQMDKLLEYCFLKACKTSVKSNDLPILSSNFFKNHVLTACPPDQTLDVKQSSFKKLSAFLNSMEAKGIIITSTFKGVQSILFIKTDHELIRNLKIFEKSTKGENEFQPTVITECYKVTSNVLPIISKFGYEKGDVLKRAEIRKIFHDYVKKEGLQQEGIFKLNGPLADVFHTNESVMQMKMEDGINKFIGKMTLMKEITTGETKVLHTGKVEPIDIIVSTRGRFCKKVTLISNLEIFGIKLDVFSKECQEIGASATVTDIPGKKTPSVLVQGNQVIYVYKLLTEKYQINKNYIRGLEYAPKKKK